MCSSDLQWATSEAHKNSGDTRARRFALQRKKDFAQSNRLFAVRAYCFRHGALLFKLLFGCACSFGVRVFGDEILERFL
mgnify:CR=1 FL=1